jgi:hypothetical protein
MADDAAAFADLLARAEQFEGVGGVVHEVDGAVVRVGSGMTDSGRPIVTQGRPAGTRVMPFS